jgi:peptidoglycan/xylan/chitin deacetylase (PgdA/CDA1 family)
MTSSSALWDAFARDVERATAAGRTMLFWWRDDDCSAPSPRLDTLLSLHAELAVPLTLAVIPLAAESLQPLFDRLRGCGNAAVVQHGAYHRNHSPSARVATEIGGFRPLSDILGELAAGQAALLRGQGMVPIEPVLVPPWNRIREDVLPHLRGMGFRGLSRAGPRRIRHSDGLSAANVHLDLVDWSNGERCLHEAAALGILRAEITRIAAAPSEMNEPIGINTHHLVAQNETWDFLRRLVHETTSAGARWPATAEVFEDAPRAA